MRFDKKLLLQVLPCVVSGAALVWCMKQCSSIDDVQAVNDAQSHEICLLDSRTDSLAVVTDQNGQAIDRVARSVSAVNDRVNAAMDSIDAINARVDSIRAANKVIKARVDSLAQVTKDCRAAKAKAKKKAAAKHNCAPKPQPVVTQPVCPPKPQPVVTQPRPVVVAEPAPAVKIENGGCGNTNVVNINNGGTVNNYYGTSASCAAEKDKQPTAVAVFTYRRVRKTTVVVENTR